MLAVFAYLNPPLAHARESSMTCTEAAGRPSIYAAAGLEAIGGSLEWELRQTPGERVSARPTLGGRVGAAVHVVRDHSVRFEFSRARAGFGRRTVGRSEQHDLPDGDLGDLRMSQFIVSYTRQAPRKGRNCGYIGAGAGVTRFTYEDSSGKGPVVSGFFAYERLLTSRRSALVEVEVQAIGYEGRSPLAESTVFVIKVSAGLRWRF
jgi:hypothetical protein